MRYTEKTWFVWSSMCKFRSSRMWLLLFTVLGTVTGNSLENESKIKRNPEASLNISERIQYWGYPAEEYDVLTDDGYYLSLNRIPGGSKGSILLLHGFIMDGSVWISNPPHESLGFILADANYDVWIGNVRGNTWSRKHINLTIDQEEFWNFSFHEMGIFDFPAMVNFILKKTGRKKIFYAGHSQGSTMAFIGLSVIPQMNEKIKMLFAFAPGYNFHFSPSPLMVGIRLPRIALKTIFGKKEFQLLSPRLRTLLSKACSIKPVDKLCELSILLLGGFNAKNLNESRTDVYYSTLPDYTSVKNVFHWKQAVETEEFKYYDYGPDNLKRYHQATPPFYEIERITVPIAVWTGEKDLICRPKEMAQLLPRLRSLIYTEHYPDWDHWDFIWGIDAHQRMYLEILNFMEK